MSCVVGLGLDWGWFWGLVEFGMCGLFGLGLVVD